MKTAGGSDAAKRRAGERAAEDVADGFVVGLGTGSTTAYAIEALGRAVDDGLEIRGIPTSFQSRRLALEVGIELTTLDAVEGVDLAIDGADQVADDPAADGYGALIKGGGAAHTREKLVDAAADRFVVVADPSKLAPTLERSVPIEVIPDAHTVVADRVRDVGGEPTLREAEGKDGPVVTDNGNLVLDCAFGSIDEPEALATRLSRLPGVVEHGLFVGLADATYVGTEDGVEVRDY
ncbi:ribose 5-phosphate isomerase [Haloterrigena turkmenica DSM 5511]|uniref:Ribose-5-phosphate isomerase A n=1 Tax=Haloterrigena turkmenica (strain ATCC 51198 / DSM 5511 / JCM 9101 / NCIMB 13204 / VKM B-1734 / 4k) TaxID=543526 RepID=D2RS03_HALTV|nr:ribose-5-phosphate isomerase RpiA [Haloterrigena turkmenica]ADB62620.1 ribose 5-phosphate isomerase [Haloterrigena turkmenica DSM 5511]